MKIQKPTLSLVIVLMMFPQIVETIYSPALTDIAQGFNVDARSAGQTLSLYFFAFAIGVVTWGRLCDVIGRRSTMLLGLTIYALASFCALFINEFSLLLIIRACSAFGAAVGSVATQTIMRDSYSGNELARVFSIMGAALAISPALGMLSGAGLVYLAGYQAVFCGLAILATILVIWTLRSLPETCPEYVNKISISETFLRMIFDKSIWINVLLIAFFNISLFSYYQIAPFYFEKLGFTQQQFGYSGLLLAAGVALGSSLNRWLLSKLWKNGKLIMLASLIGFVSALITALLSSSILFVLPVVGIVVAYGIAIPNILANVLANYRDCLGTAGALLGLFYYVLIGAGLALAGLYQQLGLTLVLCSLGYVILAYFSNRSVSFITEEI